MFEDEKKARLHNMTSNHIPELSEITIDEVNAFFRRRLEGVSKENMWLSQRETMESLLRACGFVYVSQNGSVLHFKNKCGNPYNDLIPADIAFSKGYRKYCSKCKGKTP